MQGIIETLLGSEKIRRSSEFIALFAKLLIGHCVSESELRDVPTRSPSAFLDYLQILPELDPAAGWKEATEIYAGVNHAIAADNRTGIDDRIAADLGSVADNCAEFS